MMVVAIVNGALIFTADLLRQLSIPLRLDCLRASSYHDGTKAVGEPRIVDQMKLDVRDQHVLLVDDIVDFFVESQQVGEDPRRGGSTH